MANRLYVLLEGDKIAECNVDLPLSSMRREARAFELIHLDLCRNVPHTRHSARLPL